MNSVGASIERLRGEAEASWFVGKRSNELVEAAERTLGFSFPASYRLFVRELGAGSVGAAEIFGITTADFVESAIPNGVWLTLDARESWGLPATMMVVHFDGGVDYYVMDCSREDPPLLLWRPGVTSRSDELEVVAENFGRFLSDLIEREL